MTYEIRLKDVDIEDSAILHIEADNFFFGTLTVEFYKMEAEQTTKRTVMILPTENVSYIAELEDK